MVLEGRNRRYSPGLGGNPSHFLHVLACLSLCNLASVSLSITFAFPFPFSFSAGRTASALSLAFSCLTIISLTAFPRLSSFPFVASPFRGPTHMAAGRGIPRKEKAGGVGMDGTGEPGRIVIAL